MKRTSGNHEKNKSGSGGASRGTRSWIHASATSFNVHPTPWIGECSHGVIGRNDCDKPVADRNRPQMPWRTALAAAVPRTISWSTSAGSRGAPCRSSEWRNELGKERAHPMRAGELNNGEPQFEFKRGQNNNCPEEGMSLLAQIDVHYCHSKV